MPALRSGRTPGRLLVAVLLLLAGCASTPGAPAAAGAADPAAPPVVRLTVLAINDFHGALLPRRANGRDIGGAAWLAGHLKRRAAEVRAEGAEVVVVHAGDMVGASPAESALLKDEPTVLALDAMGVGFGAVGNHELDEGLDELLRLQRGGCHPVTEPRFGCFKGARFQWLAANVVREGDGVPVLPPYGVVEVGGVRVAFIGVVLEDAPEVVAAAATRGLRVLDEAETVNRYAGLLARQGIHAVMVLLHQGGTGSPDGKRPIEGPVVDVVSRFGPEVDAVMTGHTHQAYTGRIDRAGGGGPIVVAQAHPYGTSYAEFTLVLDRRGGDVAGAEARLVRTYHQADSRDPLTAVAPDEAVAAIVARAESAVAAVTRRVVATAAAPIRRAAGPTGESALGSLVADAHRAATGADVAFTNAGGLRDDLPAGPITYGRLFAVQPFGNPLVTMTLTGDEIRRLLELQWRVGEGGRPIVRILPVSGLTYAVDPEAPPGRRVSDLRLAGGAPLVPDRRYTVTVNSFLAEGGDGFALFREGRDRRQGPLDIDALESYLARLPQPVTVTVEGRIRRAGR